MNKQRRKQIEKAIGLLSEARAILEEVTDEEQEAFDNLPEGLQQSERGELMDEGISRLIDVYETIEEHETELDDIINP